MLKNKPSLLILNQYFPPDRAATAILLGQLTQELAESFEVTVVCGTPTYNPAEGDVSHERLSVHRIPLFSVSRTSMIFRLMNYALFSLGCLFKAIRLPSKSIVMCWTDPPWISGIAALICAIKGSKLILVHQDIYPEILLATKKMKPGRLFSFFQRLSSIMLSFADHHVVIGEEMLPVLASKKVPRFRMTCIENWQDLDLIQPVGMDKNTFRSKYGIAKDAFVVMHSGNIGLSQNLDLLLDAASLLTHESIVFVLIGDGAKKIHLQENASALKLTNVIFLPYQDESALSQSLSSADIHYVSLLPEFSGVLVPSKIYGIMAAAKPTLGVLPDTCSVSKTILASRSGVLCPPDPKVLAEKILELSKNPNLLAEFSANARDHAQKHGGKHRAAQTYANLLNQLLGTL